MKILVTGATGFVGQSLVKALLETNHEITCFVRNTKQLASLNNLKFQFGDINDSKAVDKAIKGQDIVYHLVGIGNVNSISDKAYELFRKINVEGTKNILDSGLKHKVKKIIYLSSTAAIGLVKRGKVDEQTPCNPSTPYQKSKFESEELIRDYYQKYALPVVILRPSMVYGPGMYHGALIQVNNLFKKRIIPLVDGGKTLIPAVHVEDVVSAILLATKNGKNGEVYIITNEEQRTLKEIIDMMEKRSKKKILKINIPKSLIKVPVFFIQRYIKIISATSFTKIGCSL